MHFEGDRRFPQQPDEIFAKLSDASFLVNCVKDAEDVTEKTADRSAWKMRPNFSFVRTTLDITMEILERQPVSGRVRVQIFSRGIGATATVLTALHVEPYEGGSAVHWEADLTELTGLLKMVPKGLISSSAGKVIEETWAAIDANLLPAVS